MLKIRFNFVLCIFFCMEKKTIKKFGFFDQDLYEQDLLKKIWICNLFFYSRTFRGKYFFIVYKLFIFRHY
jgi:hypothetical protein